MHSTPSTPISLHPLKPGFVTAIAAALIAGLAIGYRDLRADDVQLAVALILVASASCAAVAGGHGWLIAILVAVGVPIMHAWAHAFARPVAYETTPIGLLLPFIPALLGAYVGLGARAILSAR